jgi:predicted metal-dependent hydrolase
MARSATVDDPAQLSLFDAGPASAPSAPRATTGAAPPPDAGRHPGRGGVRAVTGPVPAPAPAGELAPVEFRHPQSERELLLGGHVVGYALRRGRRRSIGFVVSPEGLAVNAPRWVALRDVDAAVRTKADWILRKLREQRERARRLAAARIDWRDGTGLPFLGETVILVLDPRVAGAVLNADADWTILRPADCGASPFGRPGGAQSLPGLPRLTLHVGLPQTAAPEQIRDAVQSWLQRQALRIFAERCRHFAPELGVTMRRLSLSAAQTRWGSASADGSIRLNWRLVHFGMEVIDYVVAHELAHLREMNHSAAFWDVVRSVVPDFERMRTTLREIPVPVLD